MSSDHWEISGLYARYAELLNLGQIDEVAELFRHGRITIEGNPNGYSGTDEIAAMYRESTHFGEKLPDTLLFTTNLQIEVDGDIARGRAYFMALHQKGTTLEPVVGGRYHDEFRRVDGTWCFHHRHMLTDLVGDLSTHMRRPIDEYLSSGGPAEEA